jgi:putative copper resistance protein D
VNLLVDLFGYLAIIIHGVVIAAQSVAIGGVVFLVFLARPRAWLLGQVGTAVLRDAVRLAAWGALALALAEAARIALDGAVLATTVDLGLKGVLTAEFAIAGEAKIAAALLLALLLACFGARVPAVIQLGLAALLLAAATATTHAAARLEDRPVLLGVTALHLLGAAIWIGGIPAFVAALARVKERAGWRVIGARFSDISKLGVACILASGAVMSWYYIGSLEAFYGTAYGVMVGAKIAMFLALLGLGFGNYLTVRRMEHDRTAPAGRMRRFAEAEIGIGFTVFFAAASLTSVPPAVDLTQDRVTLGEIIERNTPELPRLTSPEHDRLTLPALQAKLDAEAAARAAKPVPAFIPGSGEIAPRNAEDIAWSEYNHHWSGIFVLAIGLLALLHRAGFGPARHWPLLFLGLAAFLFIRSDPEVWPLGSIGFLASLRDVEVLQHRFFVVLIIVFGLFEWRVRAGGWNNRGAALVFPLVTAIGGAALLTHSHAIANVKDQLLVELTHTPLALAGIAAGWARWLELRLDPPENRIAGWVWPACFVLVGAILLMYREA